MIEIFDIDQGSDAWRAARLGIPTASRFADILAKGEGKTRRKYMLELAGEILTGEPAETYSSAHMERGKIMEDEARRYYAFIHDVTPKRVGFVRNGNTGCSPDSLIGDRGGLEIKTAIPAIQIARLETGTLPSEHKAQVQGSIWITEREWWDFVSYWPKLPQLDIRIPRDDGYIAALSSAVAAFNEELAELVERIRCQDNPERVRRQFIMSNALLAG